MLQLEELIAAGNDLLREVKVIEPQLEQAPWLLSIIKVAAKYDAMRTAYERAIAEKAKTHDLPRY